MKKQQIYVSYAWGGESETVVDSIYSIFTEKGYNIIRDKADLGYKGNIKEFMQQIGTGGAIIVVISDKYLKSENCMFEMVEVHKNGEIADRIFPIILADADIYKAKHRLNYIKHWESEVRELNESMKGVDNMALITEIQQELTEYNAILNTMSEIATLLKNMNALTPEMHAGSNYQSIIDAMGKTLVAAPENSTEATSVKQTKNTNNTTGNGNVMLQDVQGGNININIAAPQNTEKQAEKRKRIDTSLQGISDFRKKRVLKRLEMLYKLLDDYENKLALSDNPKEKMSCENEIEKLGEQIEKAENEVNS